jgi:enoyl-CoA hydratase/carnithine racemase
VSDAPVVIARDGHVLRITLNRPEARNALDWESLQSLSSALHQLDHDDELWIGLLTGTGEKSFCAGADLKKLPQQVAEHAAAGAAPPLTPLTGLWVDKPLVCAVNGDALGGGLELALGCDVRLAAEHAVLGLPEARWSLVPAGTGTWRLPREIGRSRATALMMTGRSITATTAAAWGLIDTVAPAAELEKATEALLGSMLDNGPLALRAIKRLVHDAEGRSLGEGVAAEQQAIATLQASADAQEGLLAFLERRTPVWQAR